MIQVLDNPKGTYRIRTVQAEDFMPLVTMGKAFYAEGKLPGHFSAYHFTEFWTALLESGIGELWVLMKDETVCGAIGFMVTKDPNDGALVANELFWFLQPAARGHGLALLDMFETRAKNRGCQRMLMVHLASLRSEAVAHLYQRRGYKLLESHYLKETN